MNIFSKIIKIIYNPESFPFGNDVELAEIIKKKDDSEILFRKKFKKNKIDKYIKTLYFIKELNSFDFTPRLIQNNNSNLELKLSYCGILVNLKKNLPIDWKIQLRKIKKELMKKEIIFVDWGPWEVNPFILNNICVFNNKFYFIDFGDCKYESPDIIENYFENNIKHIEYILKWPYLYLIYHYIFAILYMIYRKLTRWKNVLILILLAKIFLF